MDAAEFAEKWRDARENMDYNVVRLWKKSINPMYLRKMEKWSSLEIKYRRGKHSKKKVHIKRGEQIIESLLFKKQFVKLRRNNKSIKISVDFNALPLIAGRKGQTIPDCLGILYDKHRGRNHPLSIEVKKLVNNPWYAVVECLQQVVLLRANVRAVEKLILNKLGYTGVRGAWGLVLAEKDFYKKKEYEGACKLCDDLMKDKKTQARILMASYDSKELAEEGTIEYVYGYWPK